MRKLKPRVKKWLAHGHSEISGQLLWDFMPAHSGPLSLTSIPQHSVQLLAGEFVLFDLPHVHDWLNLGWNLELRLRNTNFPGLFVGTVVLGTLDKRLHSGGVATCAEKQKSWRAQEEEWGQHTKKLKWEVERIRSLLRDLTPFGVCEYSRNLLINYHILFMIAWINFYHS